MSFTIFFAYNSSLPEPISRKLIFTKPERGILVLNLASQMTIFCLAELTSSVLEVLRWALACTVPGISAHTFLALGRSTNIAGVLLILFGRGGKTRAMQRDSRRLWGSQRYIHVLIWIKANTKDCCSYWYAVRWAWFSSQISLSNPLTLRSTKSRSTAQDLREQWIPHWWARLPSTWQQRLNFGGTIQRFSPTARIRKQSHPLIAPAIIATRSSFLVPWLSLNSISQNLPSQQTNILTPSHLFKTMLRAIRSILNLSTMNTILQ